MFKLFRKSASTSDKSDVLKAAEGELKKNRSVIESLRDYDAGKKDIHTADVERRLRNI
jgi:hypothetical protein